MFAISLVAFALLHVCVSATGLRPVVVGRMGEGPYRLVFSLVSAALLMALVLGFSAMRADPLDPLNQPLWSPPDWLVWPAIVIEVAAYLLGIAGFLTPGPTFAGFEASSLLKEEPARGLHRISRHPFMWSVMLWASAHLLVSGERYALLLYGTLAALALYGTFSIDRKGRTRAGWDKFAAATSNVPFAAILRKRNRLNVREIGWRLLVAAAVYAAVVFAHLSVVEAVGPSSSAHLL